MMKDTVKDSMKDSWTFIGLVILSVLYLFEVDFFHLTWLNGVAFVIIAVTLIPLLVSITRRFIRFYQKHSASGKQAENGKSQEESR